MPSYEVDKYGRITIVENMPMTVEQIMTEARRLPSAQINELFDNLLAENFALPDPVVERAWKMETRRRVAEIESGAVTGIPGEQVMTELRKTVGL